MAVRKNIDTLDKRVEYNAIDFVHMEVLIQFHFSKHLDKQMLTEDAV